MRLNDDTCHCERCRPDNPAPTHTRAFLIECLAREIAAMPGLAARQARLAAWSGKAIEGQLREAVKAAWMDLDASRRRLRAAG